METNEIKSLNIKLSLHQYLQLDDIITKSTFQVGNIKYWKSSTKLQCRRKEDNTVLQLLGQNFNVPSLYLFECNHGILECDIKDVIVYADVVLKKQIKNLKYIEQLNLFKDGEKSNG